MTLEQWIEDVEGMWHWPSEQKWAIARRLLAGDGITEELRAHLERFLA